jgi:glycosyltransferase involved in cell wall biosynthesis
MQISLIVPTRNRDRSLVRTMQSVVQTVSGHTDVEVLVVDNGSTDHTADCVREIAERHPRMFLRYFHDAMPGLLTGRHRGAKEARGEILAYLDDDVLLGPTWLEALEEGLQCPTTK